MATQTTRRRGSASSSRSAARRSSGNGSGEEEKYRRAAEDALQQLDWAIGYLHGIRKTEISKVLSKNRAHIRTQLLGRSEQPLPDQQTNQT
jgi:hypothetical protein